MKHKRHWSNCNMILATKKSTLRFFRSMSKRSFRPGLCTLTTTSSPFNLARWTWPALRKTPNPKCQSIFFFHAQMLIFIPLLQLDEDCELKITKTSSSYWFIVKLIKNIIYRSSELFFNSRNSRLWWERRNLILKIKDKLHNALNRKGR